VTASDTVRAISTPAKVAKPLAVGGGLLASFGAVAGMGAVCVSSACAVPVVLAAIGAGSFAAELPYLAVYRTPILVASGAAVVGGWGAYVWKRRAQSQCDSKSRSWFTASVLTAATLLLAAAFSWDAYLEAPMMALLGQ
jgi:mercuric ion transport protein